MLIVNRRVATIFDSRTILRTPVTNLFGYKFQKSYWLSNVKPDLKVTN